MSVSEVYKSLNSEQRRVLLEKQVKMNRPIDETIAFFRPLAACDKLGDKSRARFGCTGGLAIVAIIPLLIMWGNGVYPTPVALGLIAAAIVVATLLLRRYLWLDKIDLSNNLRGVVLPILHLFREDVAPDQPIQLDLDLRSPTDKTKQMSKSEPYAAGAYYKVIDTFYADPWMTGEALLTDGTRLRWSVTDSIRERKKTKRNARGKHKTKTRYSKKTSIDVEVAMKSKQYELGAVEEGTVVEGERRNTVRVKRRVKMASLDPIHPREIVDLVANVYRGAQPVK
ncbi:MAG TPA: hypothetical protein VGF69_10860 [Thermoanaerobaculia bacterium]|jgi:hypothetical protein